MSTNNKPKERKKKIIRYINKRMNDLIDKHNEMQISIARKKEINKC